MTNLKIGGPKRTLANNSESEKWFYKDTGDVEIQLEAPILEKLPLDISGFSTVEGKSFNAKLKIKGFEQLNLGLSHFSF